MEIIIGTDMEISNLLTGMTPILFSAISGCLFCCIFFSFPKKWSRLFDGSPFCSYNFL
jgi:hypothetical protein